MIDLCYCSFIFLKCHVPVHYTGVKLKVFRMFTGGGGREGGIGAILGGFALGRSICLIVHLCFLIVFLDLFDFPQVLHWYNIFSKCDSTCSLDSWPPCQSSFEQILHPQLLLLFPTFNFSRFSDTFLSSSSSNVYSLYRL